MVANLQASHWGYPQNFCERPFGSQANCFWRAQADRGTRSEMMLYRYDFTATNTATLNQRGIYKLEKIARLATRNSFPIVIQPSGESTELDSKRRVAVRQRLEQLDNQFPHPVILTSERVITGYPDAGGLVGDESTILWNNLLQQTTSSSTNNTGGRTVVTPSQPGTLTP